MISNKLAAMFLLSGLVLAGCDATPTKSRPIQYGDGNYSRGLPQDVSDQPNTVKPMPGNPPTNSPSNPPGGPVTSDADRSGNASQAGK